MTMDYSLMSFQHFWHFWKKAINQLKTSCYMTMDYSLMSFEHSRNFLDFGQKRWTIALCMYELANQKWLWLRSQDG